MMGGNSTALLSQGGIRDWGQCLVLTGNNLIALNCSIWGRREKTARHTENADFSPDTVMWPLSLGMAGGSRTLNFGVPCWLPPPRALGLLMGELEQPSHPDKLGLCRSRSWPACLEERLMSCARLEEGLGFRVVKSFQ